MLTAEQLEAVKQAIRDAGVQVAGEEEGASTSRVGKSLAEPIEKEEIIDIGVWPQLLSDEDFETLAELLREKEIPPEPLVENHPEDDGYHGPMVLSSAEINSLLTVLTTPETPSKPR